MGNGDRPAGQAASALPGLPVACVSSQAASDNRELMTEQPTAELVVPEHQFISAWALMSFFSVSQLPIRHTAASG